jgi:hypothetical protein
MCYSWCEPGKELFRLWATSRWNLKICWGYPWMEYTLQPGKYCHFPWATSKRIYREAGLSRDGIYTAAINMLPLLLGYLQIEPKEILCNPPSPLKSEPDAMDGMSLCIWNCLSSFYNNSWLHYIVRWSFRSAHYRHFYTFIHYTLLYP